MANGDITSIEELGRFGIPGAGHNLAGVAKNNKVFVWGRLTATYAAAGINLANEGGRAALGVGVADFISLDVRSANAAFPGLDTNFLANLDASDKIFVVDEVGTANPAVPTPGEVIVIDYFAIGEDNRSVELT
jgi:hypothetical protein